MLMRTEAIYQRAPGQQPISGRNERTPVERAFVGADLHLGRVPLEKPTIKQSAALVRVCVPYVHAALTIADDQDPREAVLAGKVSLLDAARSTAPAETLAERFIHATPEERLDCARAFGPARVWDEMISPLV